MPSVTFDAQAFSIDSRRRWLVSGLIDPAKVPSALWRDRLRAARQAGLNCVGVPVVWSRHEPAPGKPDFTGQLDIGAFVRAAGAEGLLCILRPGPFVGAGHDRGGLPAWLEESPELVLRSPSQRFLEAWSRFLSALADEVRELQVTSARPGPIVLVQCEHRWFCGDDALGQAYLGELARYLRESGFRVPALNTNNLYQSVEGQIEAWNGYDALFSMLRQLRAVRPDQPRMVVDFEIGRPAVWGREPRPAPTPDAVVHRLAQAMAAGAMTQLGPFHAGTFFDFSAGRLPFARDGHLATGQDHGAPLSETGARTETYHAVKRISTFASSFERVLTGLDPERHPASADPASGATSVVHCRGAQGDIVFAFRDDAAKGRQRDDEVRITLEDGSPLSLNLSGQPVVWALLNTLVTDRITLDWCSLSAFARVGRVFVCFGPAGARASISINGSAIEPTVPTGKTPLIEEHEGVVVVVCNEQQIDAAYATDDAVFIGAASLDNDNNPVAHPAFRQCLRIDKNGDVEKAKAVTPLRKPVRPALEAWRIATVTPYIDGAGARYATIPGPSSLEALGAPYGYGWIRLQFTSGAARKVNAGFFDAADRLHVWVNNKPAAVYGLGPGASDEPPTLSLRKGANVITVLADNLGRASGGAYNGERKGIYGHVWDAAPLKAGKPALHEGQPLAPLQFRSPLTRLHADDRTSARRPTWEILHRKKTPLAVVIDSEKLGGLSGLLVVNDTPVRYFTEGGWDRVVLTEARLARGKNTIQLAVLGEHDDILARAAAGVSFFDCAGCVTDTAEWAFAKWEIPDEAEFTPASKAAVAKANGSPCWWSTTFKVKRTDSPLLLDLAGMTKGQIYLNGRNVGRYFVATAKGQPVPGQSRYYLPEPWLRTDGDNELLLFDEHAGDPAKVTLQYE